MILAIGSDHAGFYQKEIIKVFLEDNNYTVIDKGTNSSVSVDYPKYGHLVGIEVVEGKAERGIVICGSGIGISISANKIKGVRAALCNTQEQAVLSRKHNDSNILALGARIIKEDLMKKIILDWLNTKFEGGRHQNRIEKIEYE